MSLPRSWVEPFLIFWEFLSAAFRQSLALAIKEALRRKVILVTFGIFALTLLFGGWFLNGGTMNPDRIYVNFVLWGTQLLVLFMGHVDQLI